MSADGAAATPLFQRLDGWLERYAYATLLAIYFLIRVPDVWAIDVFATLVWPLNFLYFATLLLSGAHVNPAIADSVLAPANASLVYPPGIYVMTALAGSVRNVFYFMLLLQAAVPLLSYRLVRGVAPATFAWAAAIAITHYGTSARTWYPDYVIQPLILAVTLVVLKGAGRIRPWQLFMAGLTAGLIVVVKHNVGIFFGALVVALLFLQSCDLGSPRKNGLLPYLFTGAVLAGGLVFGRRLQYWDEVVFYLVPYFGLWAYVLRCLAAGDLTLDSARFIKSLTLFGVPVLIGPVIVFVWFGRVIGFQRYWYVLFGMGWAHIAFWDYGILRIVKAYSSFEGRLSGNVAFNLASLVAPGLIGLAGAATLWRWRPAAPRLSEQLIGVAMAVMATFMVFPLEDHKITVTKAVLFLYVAALLLKDRSPVSWRRASYAAVAMLLPIAASTARNVSAMARLPVSSGTSEIRQKIALPLRSDIAAALSAQIGVLHRSVGGEPYFVLESPDRNLLTLPALVDTVWPQYYVRFDAAAMDDDVAARVEGILDMIPFVLVSSEDYRTLGRDDGYIGRLLDYTRERFVIVDEYREPASTSVALRHIDGFLVLKSKTKIPK